MDDRQEETVVNAVTATILPLLSWYVNRQRKWDTLKT